MGFATIKYERSVLLSGLGIGSLCTTNKRLAVSGVGGSVFQNPRN